MKHVAVYFISVLVSTSFYCHNSVADLEGVLGVPWNPPFDRTTIVYALQDDSLLVLIVSVWFQLCTCIVAAEQTCLIFGDKFSAVNQLQGLGIHFLDRAAYFELYKPHPL